MVVGSQSISRELKKIETILQPDAREFHVGVSHAALDEERELNTRIREKLESLIPSLQQLKTAEARRELLSAQKLLKMAAGNAATLRYLESISCMEGIFADITRAATITSVELSKENATSDRVLGTRFLAGNVKQCWEYTAQVATLAASHLKAAADYHQFNHSANEIRQHSKRMLKISKRCVQAFQPDGRVGEAARLSTELEERLNVYEDLSARARELLQTSGSLLQVGNRLVNVRNGRVENSDLSGTIMVQVLINYVGSNFTVHKGEILQLIDTTESPYLWKVKASSGAQYVPSVACIIISSTDEMKNNALSAELEVLESWKESLENYKKQLTQYYTRIFQNIGTVHIKNEQAKNRFLDDVNRLLIKENPSARQLVTVFETLPNKLISGGRKYGEDDVWDSADISVLHRPILCLSKHTSKLRMFEETSGSFELKSENFIDKFSRNAKEITDNLENLRYVHDQNKSELKELYNRVQSWKNSSLDAPSKGMGRIVLSQIEMSSETSGVSSEEFIETYLPRPPSPFGRITMQTVSIPTTISMSSSEEIYVGSPEINIEPVDRNVDKLSTPESIKSPEHHIFSGSANLYTTQTHTGVSVKRKNPVVNTTTVGASISKYVRDVTTQIMVSRKIHESQTENRNNASNCNVSCPNNMQTDCITQVGIFKSNKETQVEPDIINANIRVPENDILRTDIEYHEMNRITAHEQALWIKKLDSFTTIKEPPIVSTNINTKLSQQDLQTQITDVPHLHRILDLDTRKASLDTSNIKVDNRPTIIKGMHADIKGVELKKFQTKCESQEKHEMTVQLSSKSLPIVLNTEQTMNENKPKSISCQVGTILIPKEIKVSSTNVDFSAKPESIDLGIENYSVMYPVSVVLEPLLTEECGIRIVHLKEVEHISFSDRRGSYSAEVRKDSAHTTSLSTKKMRNENTETNTDELIQLNKYSGRQILLNSGCQLFIKDKQLGLVGNSYNSIVNHNSEIMEHSKIIVENIPKSNTLCANSSVKNIKNTFVEGPILENNTNISKNYRVGELNVATSMVGDVCTYCLGSGIIDTISQSSCGILNSQTLNIKLVNTIADNLLMKSTKNVYCQVGTILIPNTIKVSATKVDFGNELYSNRSDVANCAILYPTSVLLEQMLTEYSGIHIVDLNKVEEVSFHDKKGAFVAEIVKMGSGTTTSNVEKDTIRDAVSNFPESKQINDYSSRQILINSEFQIRIKENQFGLLSNFNEFPLDFEFETEEMERQNVEDIPFSKDICVATQVGTILKPISLQVIETKIKDGGLQSKETINCIPSQLLCPCSINLKSQLSEMSGFRVVNIGDIEEIEIITNGNRMKADVESITPKTDNISIASEKINSCEVWQCNTNSDTIASCRIASGVIEIANTRKPVDDIIVKTANCTLVIDNKNITSICAQCLRNQIESDESHSLIKLDDANHKPVNDLCERSPRRCKVGDIYAHCSGPETSAQVGHIKDDIRTNRKKTESSNFDMTKLSSEVSANMNSNDAICQVGIFLIPTTVQVADMCLDVNEANLSNYLQLGNNSILFPSSVNLKTELTEKSGINVMDVRDVTEIGVVFENRKMLACVEDGINVIKNNSEDYGTHDKCYLAFKCKNKDERRKEVHTTSKTKRGITQVGKKLIDSSAKCTFKVKQIGDETNVDSTILAHEVLKFDGINGKINQCVIKFNATTQVGLVMVPNKIKLSETELVVKDNSIKETRDVEFGSIMRPSVIDYTERLFETSGVNFASLHGINDLEIEFNNEKSIARVETCEMCRTGQICSRTVESLHANYSHSKASKLVSASYARSTVGSYMATIHSSNKSINGLVQTGEQVIELISMVDLKTRTGLWISEDLYDKISSENKFSNVAEIRANSSNPDGEANKSKLRINSNALIKLCDVACEALIRPNTLEKRVQTN